MAHAAYVEEPASPREFGSQDPCCAIPLPRRAGQWGPSPLDRARLERLLENRKGRLELIRAALLAMHREFPTAGAFARAQSLGTREHPCRASAAWEREQHQSIAPVGEPHEARGCVSVVREGVDLWRQQRQDRAGTHYDWQLVERRGKRHRLPPRHHGRPTEDKAARGG